MRVTVAQVGETGHPCLVTRVSSYRLGTALVVKVHTDEKYPLYTVGSGGGPEGEHSDVILWRDDDARMASWGEEVQLFPENDEERALLFGLRYYGEGNYGPDILFVAMDHIRAAHGMVETLWAREYDAASGE